MPGAVSVIIPTFNRGHVLGEALQSVLAQVHREFEVIVVDDGSSDDTRELVDRIARADHRVRYHHQQNAGAASARNTGLQLATARYLAFLDSDDAWNSWHLGLQLACLDRLPDAGLIWTDIDAVDEDGRIVSRAHLAKLLPAYKYFSRDELFSGSFPLTDLRVELPDEYRDRKVYFGDIFSAMVMGNLVLASSVVMRRELVDRVGRFDEQLVTGEDYEFFQRATRASPVAYADIPSVRYRIGTSDKLSGPAMALPMARGYLKVLDTTLDRDAARITLSPTMIRQARSYAHRTVGATELEAGSPRVAREHFAAAVRIAPRPETLMLLLATFLPRSVTGRLIRWRRARARSARGKVTAAK